MALNVLFCRGEIRLSDLSIARLSHAERFDMILRHITGDWSGMAAEDIQSNHDALKDGGEILSLFYVRDVFWIVRTNAERTLTELMKESERD